jgi:hypothetical protein
MGRHKKMELCHKCKKVRSKSWFCSKCRIRESVKSLNPYSHRVVEKGEKDREKHYEKLKEEGR